MTRSQQCDNSISVDSDVYIQVSQDMRYNHARCHLLQIRTICRSFLRRLDETGNEDAGRGWLCESTTKKVGATSILHTVVN